MKMHSTSGVPVLPAKLWRLAEGPASIRLTNWSMQEQQVAVSKNNEQTADKQLVKDLKFNYQSQIGPYLPEEKLSLLTNNQEQSSTPNNTKKYLKFDGQLQRFIKADKANDQLNTASTSEIQDILDLLQKGNEDIEYATNQDVILLLGNTGAGKSTLTQFIAGNNDNLISVEIGDDTGEFIIKDISGDKISNNSTITSKTILPELVVDPEANIAFYDCPGFSDTRSAAHDISATYFIKNVIDSAKAIKLVFAVSYPSVRQGVNRQDFMLLVRHSVSMIKDIDKFKDSIALIVTKVDNMYNKSGLVSDEKVIGNIATFLKRVRDELETNMLNGQKFNEDAVKFIDILLAKEGQFYPKIGIFRRPDEPGALSNITLLQDGKKSLKTILYKNIQFYMHDEDDFGYTISSDSLNYVHILVEKINENIASDVVNLGREIETHYTIQEEKLHEIQVLYNEFKLGYDSLSTTKVEASGFVNLQQFIKQITKNIDGSNIVVSSENLLNIVHYAQYLKFIKSVSNQANVFNPLKWAEGLTDIVDYLGNSLKWYDFLISLHTSLSKYDIQKDTNQYSNVTDDLKNQIATNGHQKENISESMKQFLDKVIREDSEREYNKIKDIKINKFKLDFLNRILDLTLKHNMSFSCDKQKLVVKGYNIKLSDIAKVTCIEPESIEVFALSKVFIDIDFDKTGEKVLLSIIAPTWEIVGSHNITLDGKPGEAQAKASNGVSSGGRGEDGMPGYPGGAAGHFLGIGETFINSQYLKITADGGNGGSGQEGGDGVDGESGKTLELPRNGVESSVLNTLGFSHKQIDYAFRGVIQFSKTTNYYMYTYEVYGKDGQKGGNGGDGGLRSKGGVPGKIILIGLNTSLVFSVRNVMGLDGNGGNGGRGGVGGRNGDMVKIKYTKKRVIKHPSFKGRNEYYWDFLDQTPMGTASSGSRGINDHNNRETQQPEEAVQNTHVSHTINGYKNYLRENLRRNMRESASRKFMDHLENQKSVTDLYNTLGLIHELQGLEDQCYKLRTEISCLPFYKSLLLRIGQYAEKPANQEKSIDYKKVLSYLYTATLSRIYSINNNVSKNLVIDLQEYLNLITRDINNLNKISNTITTNEYKINYQQAMNEKTNEAENFIDTQIKPEIDNIFKQTNDKIELLISETVALQNATKEEKIKLQKQQQELEKSSRSKKILGVINIASKFLGFLGPLGAAVSSVIGGRKMIADSLTLGGTDSAGTTIALPSGIKNSITRISDQLKNKQQLFAEQLHDVDKQLQAFLDTEPSKDIEEIKKKLSDTKLKLDQEIAKGATFDNASMDKINILRKEAEELLQQQKEVLKEQKPDIDIKIAKQLRIVNHVSNILSITDISMDFYKKVRNDQTKIDNLGEAIKQTDVKLAHLEEYEKNIYRIIIPICKDMQNRVETMEQNLKDKSHVALDISKWQIQSTTRDVKLQLKKMTEEFQVQEDLMRCMEKLEEGMTTMINVYDRIEDYHDKATFAAYIADINSDKAIAIKINDQELSSAIDGTKLIIQSNLVLEKYESAMNAFRQHKFPFADYYLGEFNLPSSLNSSDYNSVMSHVVNKIENLQAKEAESTATINKYDKFIHNNIIFNSNSSQISPFLVWQHKSNEHTIKMLLEGKEITIKADITQGFNKNAIKFNVIGIRFKLANEATQHDLDQQLQDFEVTMTHLGNSYYRCNNKFYTITSDKQVINYSFGKSHNGEPLNKNLVYDKIKNSNPVLSPYTLWKIKLNNTRNNFDKLAKYKNQVINLELEGRGQYVDQEIDVCNGNLNKYYMLDDTISGIDNINVNNQQGIGSTNIRRDRRSVDEQNFIQGNVEKSPFVMNGAFSYVKSSFINNIINSSLKAFKGLNIINQISKWFVNDGKSFDQAVPDMSDYNDVIVVKLLNFQSLHTELPMMSNKLLENESTTTATSIVVDDSLLYNHGNLLLLDCLIRRKSGVKYINKGVAVSKDYDCEYAQSLAYREYVHI